MWRVFVCDFCCRSWTWWDRWSPSDAARGQISLDDPLVSRVHAQVTLSDTGATVRDLGSRNGVRVNGHLIHDETPLTHKDRLRLGTQDLVFLTVRAESTRVPRATGSLVHCQQCGRPFPIEVSCCPHCGTPAPNSEVRDTVTSVESEGSSWTFRLLAEVIERALASGRLQDAERMLDRAARALDALIRAGEHVGDEQVTHAARLALRWPCTRVPPTGPPGPWGSIAARWCCRWRCAGSAGGHAPELLRVLRPELEALLSTTWSTAARREQAEKTPEEQRLAILLRRDAS